MHTIWFPDFGELPAGLPELREWIFYSFPHKPRLTGKCRVLSSGTWGLASLGKGNYGVRGWNDLYNYYIKYAGIGTPGWRMMPDEYLHPYKTMKNFKEWYERFPDMPVIPIIQFSKKKHCDIYLARKQIQFYWQYNPDRICISNPGFRCDEWLTELSFVSEMCKDMLGGPWIHVLGAGWDMFDITQYLKIDTIDSIDSIAYYTAARDGVMWLPSLNIDSFKKGLCNCPACESDVDAWARAAMHNAYVAQEVVKNYRTG